MDDEQMFSGQVNQQILRPTRDIDDGLTFDLINRIGNELSQIPTSDNDFLHALTLQVRQDAAFRRFDFRKFRHSREVIEMASD